jgi:hypothetical protein
VALAAIGRGFLGAARSLGRAAKSTGQVFVDASKADKGMFGKGMTLIGAGSLLGAVPFVGTGIRSVVPGGSFLAPSLTGNEESGATSNYVRSRDYAAAAGINNNPLPPRTSRPLRPGLSMKKDRYGNPTEQVKAAHALREKLAGVKIDLSPSQMLLYGAGALGASQITSHFLGNALNKMERGRRDISRQSGEKKTLGILSRVNPAVQEDPQTRAKARTLYGIVHRNAPFIAKEPVVAASVINTMLNSPTDLPTPDQFQMTAKLQKDTESSRERRPFQGTEREASGLNAEALAAMVAGS